MITFEGTRAAFFFEALAGGEAVGTTKSEPLLAAGVAGTLFAFSKMLAMEAEGTGGAGGGLAVLPASICCPSAAALASAAVTSIVLLAVISFGTI